MGLELYVVAFPSIGILFLDVKINKVDARNFLM